VNGPQGASPDIDVLVIGGGPAGLAAAIAARLEGMSVMLAESRTPPVDKACGEGVMPDGVAILERLGVVLDPRSSFRFNGIRYIDGELEATARFRNGHGAGVRRIVLHEALARRAAGVGVGLRWGTPVDGLHPERALIGGRVVRARFVIGADGRTSRIRRALGLDSPPRRRRAGVRRHYEVEPWHDLVEVHWSPVGEVFVTPVADRRICVAAIGEAPSLRLDEAVRRSPVLGARLAGARVVSEETGAGTDFRTGATVVRGRVALVGDAAGAVDAITGKGVALGLRQAVAVAAAMRHGDLDEYQAAYRRIMRLPNVMTAMMLAAGGRPRVRHVVLEALARFPALFPALLALHVGAVPAEASR